MCLEQFFFLILKFNEATHNTKYQQNPQNLINVLKKWQQRLRDTFLIDINGRKFDVLLKFCMINEKSQNNQVTNLEALEVIKERKFQEIEIIKLKERGLKTSIKKNVVFLFYTSTKSWRGYIFITVCLSVFVSVCVCRCPTIPRQPRHLQTSNFQCRQAPTNSHGGKKKI